MMFSDVECLMMVIMMDIIRRFPVVIKRWSIFDGCQLLSWYNWGWSLSSWISHSLWTLGFGKLVRQGHWFALHNLLIGVDFYCWSVNQHEEYFWANCKDLTRTLPEMLGVIVIPVIWLMLFVVIPQGMFHVPWIMMLKHSFISQRELWGTMFFLFVVTTTFLRWIEWLPQYRFTRHILTLISTVFNHWQVVSSAAHRYQPWVKLVCHKSLFATIMLPPTGNHRVLHLTVNHY